MRCEGRRGGEREEGEKEREHRKCLSLKYSVCTAPLFAALSVGYGSGPKWA